MDNLENKLNINCTHTRKKKNSIYVLFLQNVRLKLERNLFVVLLVDFFLLDRLLWRHVVDRFLNEIGEHERAGKDETRSDPVP